MNIILITLDDQLFGIAAEAVEQVLEPPPVTPLPFVPDYVEGLGNVGGRVLPVIDLRRVLSPWMEAAMGGEMVIVRTPGDAAYALRVGRVMMMVEVDGGYTPFSETKAATHDLPEGVIRGEFEWNGRMVLVLDPVHLGAEGLEHVNAASLGGLIAGAGAEASATGHDDGGDADTPPLLLVSAGREHYALPLDSVRETVEAGTITAVPKAPPGVVGMISLRGQPLLVAALGRILGQRAEAAPAMVVILETADSRVGIGVDRILGLRRLRATERNGVSDGRGLVTGFMVDGEDRMFGVLDVAGLLAAIAVEDLRRLLPPRETEARREEQETTGGERQFLTFWLGNELCGCQLEAVERVAEFAPPQDVPTGGGEAATAEGHAHASALAGVTEIGGDVLPVVDLRTASEAPASGAYIVVRDGGARWALAVDRLSRIIALAGDAIRPASGRNGLVAEVGRMNDALVSILALPRLIGA